MIERMNKLIPVVAVVVFFLLGVGILNHMGTMAEKQYHGVKMLIDIEYELKTLVKIEEEINGIMLAIYKVDTTLEKLTKKINPQFWER